MAAPPTSANRAFPGGDGIARVSSLRKFLASPLADDAFWFLLKINLAACLLGFVLLQIWRPYFFLTDDNFSGAWPILTEIGRNLKAGHSPFYSQYLFGGNYNLARDPSLIFWHPFQLLPAFLADTPARFCLMDATALLLLLTTATGFTVLGFRLVRLFNSELPAGYIVFFTASFLFSSYILMITSSWLNFLGNQSALPWLAVGILDRRLIRATLIIFVTNVHQLFIGYLPTAIFSGLCFTVFALGISILWKNPAPFCAWIFGGLFSVMVSSPFLVYVLDGFSHSVRGSGFLLANASEHSFPAALYPFSFFLGNWTDLVSFLGGNGYVHSLDFPYLSVLLACAASWCLLPILFQPARWRFIEWLCLGLLAGLVIMTVRPDFITEILLHLPLLKSMRWPFREALQLLFFFHVLLLVWRHGAFARWWPRLVLFSSLVFLLPMPFSRIPTLNALFIDRAEILSGHAEMFWAKVRTQLKPTDQIATVIDHEMFRVHNGKLPLCLLGTADFPSFLQVRCASGYSPTANWDLLPLKVHQQYNFGAFAPSQIAKLFQQQPSLKIIEATGYDPLRIMLLSRDGSVDLTPDIPR